MRDRSASDLVPASYFEKPPRSPEQIKTNGHANQSARPSGTTRIAVVRLFLVAGCWIQDQGCVLSDLGEVKHLRDRIRNGIVRPCIESLSCEPVVFDEAENRC